VYDEASRVLAYANAGHEPPVLLRRQACHAVCERLDSLTPPVGWLPTLPALQSSVQLFPGDCLLIFTDGITEAPNGNGEEFGRERISAVVARNIGGTADEMRDAVLTELRSHSRGVVQADDVTLIAARVL
jgi:sigma-B regulation protein RsbU (phosphoserine phosphatase)